MFKRFRKATSSTSEPEKSKKFAPNDPGDEKDPLNDLRQSHEQQINTLTTSYEARLVDSDTRTVKAINEMQTFTSETRADHIQQLENLKHENQRILNDLTKQYQDDLKSKDDAIFNYEKLANQSVEQVELIDNLRSEIDHLKNKSTSAKVCDDVNIVDIAVVDTIDGDHKRSEAERQERERYVSRIQEELGKVTEQRDEYEASCAALSEMLTSTLSTYVSCENALNDLDDLADKTCGDNLRPQDNIVAKHIAVEIDASGDHSLQAIADEDEVNFDSTQYEIDEGFELSYPRGQLSQMFSGIRNQQLIDIDCNKFQKALAKRLQKHGQTLTTRLQEHTLVTETLKDDLKRLTHEKELYENELVAAKKHLMQGVDVEIANHVENLSKRNFELEKQLAIDTSQHQEQIENLKEQLQKREECFSHEIGDIKTNLDHTSNQLAISRKYIEEQVVERENEREELLCKDDQLRELSAKFNSSLLKSEDCVEQDNDELMEFKRKLKDSTIENKKLIEDMENDYKFKIQTLEQQLVDATKKFDNKSYKQLLEIDNLNKDIKSTNNEIIKNSEINEALNMEKESFKNEIKKLNKEIQDLKTKSIDVYNEKCQQMENLKVSLASEKGKNASQVMAESYLHDEIENLNEIIKAKETMPEESEIIRKNELLSQELEDVQEQVEKLNQKINDMNNCETQVNQLNELLISKSTMFESISQEKNNEIEKLNLMIKSFKEEKTDLIELAEIIENQENKNLMTEKTHSDEIMKLNKENTNLSNEIQLLNNKLGASEEEKNFAKDELLRLASLCEQHAEDHECELNQSRCIAEHIGSGIHMKLQVLESQHRERQQHLEQKHGDLVRHLEARHQDSQRRLQEKLDESTRERNRLSDIIDSRDKLLEEDRRRLQSEYDAKAEQLEVQFDKQVERLRESHVESIGELRREHRQELKKAISDELSNLESSREPMDQTAGTSISPEDDSLSSVLNRVKQEVENNELLDDKLLTYLNNSMYSEVNDRADSGLQSSSASGLRSIICKIHNEGMKTLTGTQLRLLKSYGETSSAPNDSIRQKCQDILENCDKEVSQGDQPITRYQRNNRPIISEDDSELRKLKMELQLVEYKLHLETGVAEDLRETIEQDKYAAESMSNMLKESLTKEQARNTSTMQSLRSELEDQRCRCLSIECQLNSERMLNLQLKNDFELEQKSHQQSLGQAESMIQDSINKLKVEQDRVHSLTVALSDASKTNSDARRTEASVLETHVKIEALKKSEINLTECLKKEKRLTSQLKDIIKKEREIQNEISEKEKITISDLEKCLDIEKENVCNLNNALIGERDRVSRLNRNLREINENRDEVLRNSTNHTQLLKSQINTLNNQILKSDSARADKFSRLEEERDRLQKTLSSATFADNSNVNKLLATAKNKIVELQLSENEAKRNEQAAKTLLQKAQEDSFANTEVLRLRSDLSLSKLRRHEIDDECRQLRNVTSSLKNESDVNRLKMQRLYNKYLKSESFRKSMVWQKKYLLVLIAGYRDSERKTMAALQHIDESMGGHQVASTGTHGSRGLTSSLLGYLRTAQALTTPPIRCRDNPREFFKSRVMVIVAVSRLKFMVNKWRKVGHDFRNMDKASNRSVSTTSMSNSTLLSEASVSNVSCDGDDYSNRLVSLKQRLATLKPSKYT